MNEMPKNKLGDADPPVRRPYQKPELKRVDLALAETLSQGCKLLTDVACMGPPIKAYEAGS